MISSLFSPKVFCLIFLASCLPAAAKQPVLVKPPAPVSAGTVPKLEVEPIKIDTAKLAAITPELYPDANSVIVETSSVQRYADDGASIECENLILKILTEKGRNEVRTRSFRYNIFYGETTVVLARILKPDGSTVDVNIKKNSKEMIDRSSMGSNIYDPNNRLLTLAIPGLKVGDTLHLVTKNITRRVPMAGCFSEMRFFESSSPIIHARYEIRGPKEKPIRMQALLGKVGETVSPSTFEDGEETVNVWEARDVPQMFPEEGMPNEKACMQRLLVSTLKNWEEVSRWYWDISEPHFKSTPEIHEKVQQLVENVSDNQEKIRRIFQFVSREIRYMGITIEKDSPGYEPHDVKLTFENRYGVCRDKAALLAVMLREAGFQAFPVLIMVGSPIDVEVSMPYFNHAITGIRNDDGTYQLMDSTNEYTSDLLPGYLNNKSYIVAAPEGTTLQLSPIPPAEKNRVVAKTQINVLSNGEAKGTVSLEFEGINGNAIRGQFAKIKPEEIRRTFEMAIKEVVPGATLDSLELTPKNLMKMNENIRASLVFSVPNFFEVANGKTMLQTPWFSSQFAIVTRILGSKTHLEKRRFPIEIPYACALEEKLTVNLPENIRETLALPESTKFETPLLVYNQSISREANTITGTLSMQLRQPLVKPDEYPQLKKAMRDMEFAARQMPVFAANEKTSLKADVRVLESKTEISLIDANSWKSCHRVRKEILTYAGKKSSGELKLDYNPTWETVKLESAKVTLKDGTVRTVQPAEMNLMDEDWVASAPRYPAAKTLVISLPGIEEGATVEYVITKEAKERPIFSTEKSFFGFDPVDKETFVFTAPKSCQLFIENSLDSKVVQNEGTVSISAENSHELRKREGSLPPMEHLGEGLLISTFKSPEDFASVVCAAASPLIDSAGTIKAKADELTAGKTTEVERVTAIRDYVAKFVRNAGPNFTKLPLRCLTSAAKTLADGYGNEADRSILLVSLLKAAGLDAELVLCSSGESAEYYWKPGQPLRSYLFNRLVARVSVGKNLCYLDSQSIYAALGTTCLENFYAIPFAKSLALEVIKTRSEFASEKSVSFDFNIAANGDAEITCTQKFPGMSFQSFKKMFTEMTPEQRRRYHQSRTSALSQSAKPTSELTTNFAYPGMISFSVKVPRYAVRNGNYLYFDVPGAENLATPAASDSRENPLFVSSREDVQIDWKFTLPEGMSVQMAPENIAWEGPGNYGRVEVASESYQDEKGRAVMKLRQNINLMPTIIPAASYPTLLDINRRLSETTQWRILLQESAAESQATTQRKTTQQRPSSQPKS